MDKYYRHFKGGLYKCLTIAKDSETLRDVVVYQALYGDNIVWTRDYDNFFGTVEINGNKIKRFSEITDKDIVFEHESSKK